MNRTRSRARHAAFAVISVLALAFFSGVGAVAAANATARHGARPGKPVSASVRWHTLALLSGWASSQSQYGSGDPRVAIQNGVVFLSGSMHQATPGLQRFATLPGRFRPGHNLWLPVYTFGGAVGSIEIAASGRMTASGAAATAYTSLAGISFPVTSASLHSLSLLDGWISSQSEFGSGDPQAGIQRGIVYLAGSMHQASGTGNRFATLPKRLRPAHDMWLPVYTDNGARGDIEINIDGGMWVFGGVAAAYTSLAGISFPVTSASLHNLSLVNGWVAAPALLGGKLRAGIQNGVVYVAGAVQQPSGTNDHFATLPRALRPAHNIWLPVFTSGGQFGSIEIASSGRMYAFGNGVTGYTGLAGICFPASS